MGDTFAISALRRKRAHLAGEIEKAQREITEQRKVMATLDAVIRMFEPHRDPELIPSIRPVSRNCLLFRRGELSRMCMSALRESGKPTTVRVVAEYVMAAKGLDVEPPVKAQIVEHARGALVRLAAKGFTRKLVEWPDTWWELVG